MMNSRMWVGSAVIIALAGMASSCFIVGGRGGGATADAASIPAPDEGVQLHLRMVKPSAGGEIPVSNLAGDGRSGSPIVVDGSEMIMLDEPEGQTIEVVHYEFGSKAGEFTRDKDHPSYFIPLKDLFDDQLAQIHSNLTYSLHIEVFGGPDLHSEITASFRAAGPIPTEGVEIPMSLNGATVASAMGSVDQIGGVILKEYRYSNPTDHDLILVTQVSVSDLRMSTIYGVHSWVGHSNSAPDGPYTNTQPCDIPYELREIRATWQGGQQVFPVTGQIMNIPIPPGQTVTLSWAAKPVIPAAARCSLPAASSQQFVWRGACRGGGRGDGPNCDDEVQSRPLDWRFTGLQFFGNMSLQTMVTDDFHPLPSPNLPLNPETGVGWIAGDPTIGRVAN